MSAPPPIRPRGKSALAGWWLPALFAGVSGLVTWGGGEAGWLSGNPGQLVPLLLLGGLWNASLVALVLWLWRGLTARRTHTEQLERELRHLVLWSGEEGRLRKEGLIRELNGLGARPANLEGVRLAGADLKGVDLRGCRLREADLRGADLQGALLDGADLWGANLADANLTMASLVETNLRGCDLEHAELVKADLRGASLHRASLIHTNLHGTHLREAALDKARFAPRTEGTGEFPRQVHASVEDWIRERLDGQGCYQEPDPPGQPPPGSPKAGRAEGAKVGAEGDGSNGSKKTAAGG